jgi:methionyl-tRNA formyltransferase
MNIPQNDKFVNPEASAKTVFLGTPEFAVPALKALANSEFRPFAVFCAPDKPVGRKQEMTPPPVKAAAQKFGIPVYQPANKQELKEKVLELKPDLIISAAYGIIVPKEVLETPNFGCLNIHPSLLPKYRGASPIQAAILNGDEKTGVTIFKMDEGIDTGPIIAKSEWQIANSKISTPELSKELAESGAQLLIKTLPDWLSGKIIPEKQSNSESVYAPQIEKEDGKINWQKPAVEIERQIRAFDPWPGTFSEYDGLKFKILEAEISEKESGKEPGALLLENGKLAVQTGNGSLILEKVQLEGGKPTNAESFLRGHQDAPGKKLN